MIGDYDSLPDTCARSDYDEATSGLDVQGIVWSDAGAAEPVAAAPGERFGDERGESGSSLHSRPARRPCLPTWTAG
jgi:hypothetical protein